MIVPMKRAILITTASYKEVFLEKLRALGVVHLKERHVHSSGLEGALTLRQRFEEALNFLAEYADPKTPSPSLGNPEELVSEALELRAQWTQIQEDTLALGKTVAAWEKWGDFSPQDIEELKTKGWYIVLYSANADKFPEVMKLDDVVILGKNKLSVDFVTVKKTSTILDSFQPVAWPEKGLSAYREELRSLQVKKHDVESRLQSLAAALAHIKSHDTVLQQNIEWETARVSTEEEGNLVLLDGFVPGDTTDELRSWARNHQAGLVLEEPKEPEEVPTLVRTPKWLNAMKPIFEFLGIVPGYKELDISFFFLLFFTVFFAMIIGDGGYGVIFFLGSLVGMAVVKAKGGKIPLVLVLGTLLGAATAVWGAITGSWFGSTLLTDNIPFLKSLVIPEIDTFGPDSTKSVMLLSFVLGLVHLTIAQIWNVLRALAVKPRIRALAQIGWVGINFGLFNLILNMVLDKEAYPVHELAIPVILVGLGLVVLFGSQEGHLLKGVGSGLANALPTTLNVVSAFGDIISYIRLFAVGLAGFEIAKSFNAMGSGFFTPENGVGGIIAGVIVLFLGHTLNIVLAMLGVLVHGIRLNILEFSSRLGLEWSGREYSPFKLRHSNPIKNQGKQGETYGS